MSTDATTKAATLTEFLLARIAEDEAMAYEANGKAWTSLRFEYLDERPNLPGVNEHVIRWFPARVLAKCEADRRIVLIHGPGGDGEPVCFACREPAPCVSKRLLALPYADHPDYRQEWKL